MKVTIPSCAEHDGNPFNLVTIEISNYCPKCGGKRGIETLHTALSYDGSRTLECSAWTNPCGHVDKYEDVRKEAGIC